MSASDFFFYSVGTVCVMLAIAIGILTYRVAQLLQALTHAIRELKNATYGLKKMQQTAKVKLLTFASTVFGKPRRGGEGYGTKN